MKVASFVDNWTYVSKETQLETQTKIVKDGGTYRTLRKESIADGNNFRTTIQLDGYLLFMFTWVCLASCHV